MNSNQPTKPNMPTQWELIDKQTAQRYLEMRHPDQRRLNPVRVALMVEEQATGNFHTTHQGIAFDDRNYCADGQHRLQMIVETGIAQWFLVTRNVPSEVFPYIDAGKPRSDADAARIAGITHSTAAIVATARAMRIGFSSSNKKISRSRMIAFLRRHEAAVLFAHDVVPRQLAQVRAAVGRAFYTQPHARLREFGLVMETGMPVSDERADDQAAIRLLRLLSGASPSRSKAEKHILYAKAQRALYGFCGREHLESLRESDKDLFPLPATDDAAQEPDGDGDDA